MFADTACIGGVVRLASARPTDGLSITAKISLDVWREHGIRLCWQEDVARHRILFHDNCVYCGNGSPGSKAPFFQYQY